MTKTGIKTQTWRARRMAEGCFGQRLVTFLCSTVADRTRLRDLFDECVETYPWVYDFNISIVLVLGAEALGQYEVSNHELLKEVKIHDFFTCPMMVKIFLESEQRDLTRL